MISVRFPSVCLSAKKHFLIIFLFQVHLVVATPGPILDLMEKKIANVNNCKILCLDEADKLLSQDFKGMLDRLISHLPAKTAQVKNNAYNIRKVH